MSIDTELYIDSDDSDAPEMIVIFQDNIAYIDYRFFYYVFNKQQAQIEELQSQIKT